MRLAERLLQAAIAIAGVVSIVATGGGGSGASTCFIIPCDSVSPGNPGGPGPSTPIYTNISPAHQTAQVGTAITITATTNMPDPTFSWCRRTPADSKCVVMPEFTGPQYTNPAVRIEDDGSQFNVQSRGIWGMVSSGMSELSVSSMPPVTFKDADFLDANWQVNIASIPQVGGPRITAGHQGDGSSNATMQVTFDMPAGDGTAIATFIRLPDLYDPTSQGAIRYLDFRAKCRQKTATSINVWMLPALEQGGRRFAKAVHDIPCSDGSLPIERQRLHASDFALAEGPACPVDAACPDFSAKGSPIRFGFQAGVTRPPAPQGEVRFEVDEWSITVWRP